jgi:hypothetical protein
MEYHFSRQNDKQTVVVQAWVLVTLSLKGEQ